ncbi:hypothetical protein BS47DRAFT_1353693 [Hydnum rufescens UP504]|uniref:Uncharacterized protein n=1 Tax=Hydnum rufescens UP504 TaxID=1448309 RepID=A0A9P6AH59_9AGAM|nr:hypothetical protein BS47DRAFT_1353693 [Hydnum rufescens UP504]
MLADAGREGLRITLQPHKITLLRYVAIILSFHALWRVWFQRPHRHDGEIRRYEKINRLWAVYCCESNLVLGNNNYAPRARNQ